MENKKLNISKIGYFISSIFHAPNLNLFSHNHFTSLYNTDGSKIGSFYYIVKDGDNIIYGTFQVKSRGRRILVDFGLK